MNEVSVGDIFIDISKVSLTNMMTCTIFKRGEAKLCGSAVFEVKLFCK